MRLGLMWYGLPKFIGGGPTPMNLHNRKLVVSFHSSLYSVFDLREISHARLSLSLSSIRRCHPPTTDRRLDSNNLMRHSLLAN
jgi:hypothetical protein